MNNTEKTMEKIVALCKGRGFIFPGSDIYGGLANTWDYGPLGTRLKNNVKDTWRKRFIQERKNSYEVDADILMHPRVWEASGHVSSFSDPLLDCKECKMRHRADNLIDDFNPDAHADGMTKEEMFQYIKDNSIPCPNCGNIILKISGNLTLCSRPTEVLRTTARALSISVLKMHRVNMLTM